VISRLMMDRGWIVDPDANPGGAQPITQLITLIEVRGSGQAESGIRHWSRDCRGGSCVRDDLL
jgi:hypothetical protein